MAAYIVFIRNSVSDQSEMDQYNAKAGASTAGHALTPLAFYGPNETLEGEPAEGVVLLRFDDMAAARAWYDSPAYQDALKHRLAGADYRVILTDGVG
jgi:uncharacterized protein (DUF1330 family)